MFTPLAVEHSEQHLALEFTHALLADLFLAAVIGLVNIVDEALHHACLVWQVLLELIERDAHRVERLELGHHLLEVPVFLEADGVLGHHVGNQSLRCLPQLRRDIDAVEHASAVAVDGVALAVHDVVVLQDVLSHLEVMALDLLLGALNLLGDHLGVDRHVVGHVEHRHRPLEQLGAE